MSNLTKKKKAYIVIVSIAILFLGIVVLLYEKNRQNNTEEIVAYMEGDGSSINDNNNVNSINTKENEAHSMNTEGANVENNASNIIYVHIIGEVNNEGVLKLKDGQRIMDAIELAGGVTESADLTKVNLAYVLSDGQQVNIPSIYNNDTNFEYVTNDSGENVIVDGGGNGSSKTSKININTASQTELETLTGIGPSLANKIIEYRESNGRFNSIEELKNVSGIAESKFEVIKDNITIK